MKLGIMLREQAKQHGIANAVKIMQEGVTSGKIRDEDFSLRECAQAFLGDAWAAKLKEHQMKLKEGSATAVDASGFSTITGQLFVDRVKAKYKMATFVGDQLFSVEPVTNGNLTTHREPWLGDSADDPGIVNQQEPYPSTTFGAQYIDLPAPKKYGRICRVTFEMIFSDLTGQARSSADSVGKRVGLWVEKQRLQVVASIVNNHSWNGTAYDTYQATTPWINKITDFTLDDWTDVNRIEQLFAQMLDPVTGEPIDIDVDTVLTVPTLKYTLRRILHATQTRSGDITTGAGNQTVAGNPLDKDYSILYSKHLRKMLIAAAAAGGLALTAAVADTVTFWGDFKKAFVWREVFPHRVVQAPPMSPEEFNQDVLWQIKSNVFGAPGVRDPRFVCWAYNSSAT